jgi:hypothetical protein
MGLCRPNNQALTYAGIWTAWPKNNRTSDHALLLGLSGETTARLAIDCDGVSHNLVHAKLMIAYLCSGQPLESILSTINSLLMLRLDQVGGWRRSCL